MIVYLWTAIASDTAGHSGNLGISDDVHAAWAAAEQCLRDGCASTAFVETASRVTEAHSFSPCYLPTGAGWWATSGPAGDVQWTRFTSAEVVAGLRALARSAGREPDYDN